MTQAALEAAFHRSAIEVHPHVDDAGQHASYPCGTLEEA
jgi:hypothetical protein